MSRLGSAAAAVLPQVVRPYDPQNYPDQAYFQARGGGLGEPLELPPGPILEDIDDNGNAVISHGECKTTINMDKPLLGNNYELPCGHMVAINAQALHQAVTMTLLRKQMFPTLVKPARSDSSSP